ncbi:MAG: GNAT family N-acetyltransferase [Pseudomonadales bacterium]
MGLEEQDHYNDLIGQLNFFSTISPEQIRVAIEINKSAIVGLMVLDGHELDHLYVHVDCQRLGIGSRLLREAKEKSPERIELYTFQKNTGAQGFYSNHGFTEIARGYADPVGNPWATSKEDLADIKYCWTP